MSWNLRPAAAALCVVLAAMVGGCSSSGSESKPTSAITTAGAGTEDLFVYGTIERNGKPVKGAQVDVLLESDRELAEAEIGERIESFTADTVQTDADGRFALHLKADDVPTKYFLGSTDRSALNFRLHVTAGKALSLWGSTLHPVGSPTVWRTDEAAVAADAAMEMNLDLGTERRIVTDSFGETEKSEAPIMRGQGHE